MGDTDPLDTQQPVVVDTGTTPDGTGFQSCTDLAIEPAQSTIEADGVQLLFGSGGTGDYRWSLSSGSLGSITDSGIYGAPSEPTVATVVLEDGGCTGSVSAEVVVVEAMVVQPSSAQVPPNSAVSIQVIGGSGSFACALDLDGSGASLVGCDYVSGPEAGVDVVRVTDAITGAERESVLDITPDASLGAVGSVGWMLPLGARFDPELSGGSGSYRFVVANPSIATVGMDVDRGTEYLVGSAPGLTSVTVTDSAVEGLSLTRQLRVLQPFMPPVHYGGIFLEDPRAYSRDLDGDGFAELIIGNREASVSANQGGLVAVYRGSASGPDIAGGPLWQHAGSEDRGNLGKGVAFGDLDGDGIEDLAIGSPGVNWRFTAAGDVTLYRGDGTGRFEHEPFARFTGNASNDRLGNGVGICDVDGDGLNDVLMSSQTAEPASSTTRAGAVVLYRQLATGGFEMTPVLRYGVRLDGSDWVPVNDGRLGEVGFVTGDFDHDGLCDVAAAVDGRDWAADEAGSGFVLVWSGDAARGLTEEPTQVLHAGPGDTGVRYGRYLAVGQVDGVSSPSGMPDDLLIGAEGIEPDDGSFINSGAAFLYPGAPSAGFAERQPADADWSLYGIGNYDSVGEGVGISTDGDLLVAVRGEWRILRIPGGIDYLPGQYDLDTLPADALSLKPAESEGEEFRNFGYAPAEFGDGIMGYSRYDRQLPDGSWQAVDAPGLHGVLADGTTTTWLLGEPSGQLYGRGITKVDTDGNGSPDLVVGGPEAANGLYGGVSGEVHAWTGAWTQLGDIGPTWGTSDRRGWVLSRTDFDGDGASDLVIGARTDSRPDDPGLDSQCPGGLARSSTGHLEITLQRGGPLAQSPDFLWWPPVNSARPDVLVGGFDADGDGYEDLLAGLSNDTASVVYGAPAQAAGQIHELCREQNFSVAETSSDFGISVAAIGDLDGDGCDELAIGAPREDLVDSTNISDQGSFRVLWGYSTVGGQCSRTVAEFSTFASAIRSARVGISLAGGVDLTGDGVPDLVVGSTDRAISGDRVGGAWLISGAYLAGFSSSSRPAVAGVVPAIVDDAFPVVAVPGLVSAHPSADFGRSVALLRGSGGENWVGVGIPDASQLIQVRTGGVALYPVIGGVLQTEPGWWIAGESFRDDSDFGQHLSVFGDEIIIGTPGSSALGRLHVGGAYVAPL